MLERGLCCLRTGGMPCIPGPRECGGEGEVERCIRSAWCWTLVAGVAGRQSWKMWALKKEAGYFREIFRRELFVEVA